MNHPLNVYNTLSRKKESFVPIHSPVVGMYVCGPTVYGETHLGHARPAIAFDVLFRYLSFLGYRVRYVRNITDVGHLEFDADEGEDKIAKKARNENLEPMEIVQRYTNIYHKSMQLLNVLEPSIEPYASGHIMDQIELIEEIIKNGYAYVSKGSVYFDINKYASKHPYGKLSGRVLEDLLTNTRQLDGQSEKLNPLDFALWKKASPEHIMRWKSPWSDGFPGWHMECSAMGKKYLGEVFDIHGGGMDLLFPHHECELSQSVAANGKESVKYWMHNNMITINGQKMGKALGNFITLQELFEGKHALLSQSFHPMTIRFFMLQAHYRSQLDFSNEALIAAEKGLTKLMDAYSKIEQLKISEESSFSFKEIYQGCLEALNDDLNTPIALSHIFEAVRQINLIYDGTATISANDRNELRKLFDTIVFQIMGLKQVESEHSNELISEMVELLLQLRQESKLKKDFATSDKIRNELMRLGFEIKDRKDGYDWKKL